MRFIVKVTMPVEAGNAAARKDFKVLPEILDQISRKPRTSTPR